MDFGGAKINFRGRAVWSREKGKRKEKLYFFKKCKWTLEIKEENKEISIGLYLDSKTYLKNFIYNNYRISKKEVSSLILDILEYLSIKKHFKI